jgi:hypothetical protein
MWQATWWQHFIFTLVNCKYVNTNQHYHIAVGAGFWLKQNNGALRWHK